MLELLEAPLDEQTRNLRNSPRDDRPAPASRGPSKDPDQQPAQSASLLNFEIPNYHVIEQIGAGGMGLVFRATHRWLARDVAIKLIAPHLMADQEAELRFVHEARAVGALDHPNIVRATDAGCVDRVYYLVTEFIVGENVANLVARHGHLRPSDACEIVRQAALGLQHAYEHGLVHRDIKPSNLIVDASGTVKLLDFGLARARGRQTDFTSTGQVLGTLDFLAPEQADNARNVDIRADIYSLGCTLYCLLRGAPPFSGPNYSSAASKLQAHLTQEFPVLPPRLGVPSAVQRVLQRMVAKYPEIRYSTPAEVATALARHAQGANLPALLDKAKARINTPRPNPLLQLLRGTWCLITFVPRTFLRILARCLRPNYLGQRRRPIVSIGGLCLLLVAGLVVASSQFTCVQMEHVEHFPEEEGFYWEFGAGSPPPWLERAGNSPSVPFRKQSSGAIVENPHVNSNSSPRLP